jgi:hypothetical protein
MEDAEVKPYLSCHVILIHVCFTVQMAGALSLIVGCMLDRHSLWVIAVPLALGVLTVIVSWVSTLFSS